MSWQVSCSCDYGKKKTRYARAVITCYKLADVTRHRRPSSRDKSFVAWPPSGRQLSVPSLKVSVQHFAPPDKICVSGLPLLKPARPSLRVAGMCFRDLVASNRSRPGNDATTAALEASVSPRHPIGLTRGSSSLPRPPCRRDQDTMAGWPAQ